MLGVLAAITVPTFQRVKENAVIRVAPTTLETIDRNWETIAFSDPDVYDAQIAEIAVSELSAPTGTTVIRDGAEVTAANQSGSIIATGTVTFVDGVGTIVDALIGSRGGSPSPTTTVPSSYTFETMTTVHPDYHADRLFLQGTTGTPTLIGYDKGILTVSWAGPNRDSGWDLYFYEDIGPGGSQGRAPLDGSWDPSIYTVSESGGVCIYSVDFVNTFYSGSFDEGDWLVLVDGVYDTDNPNTFRLVL